MDTLAAWIESPDPQTFPYDDVLAAFRAVGKHFVAPELLALLDRARATAPADPQLARFLDTLLDKFDGRFDNPSYLAIDQLALPTTPEGRDRLFVALLADLIRFERAPAAHLELRPEPRTADKRCHHALRAMQPALDRLGMTGDVLGQLTPAERRRLALTLVPVSTVHDEYLFIRVLQAYESTFALIAAQLAAAVAAIDARDASTAAAEIAAAAAVFRESKPLFSLIGTLQPEAFLAFREFTDGASAIQSRNYKLMESLCRTPEAERLDSPAYRSVPDVRERVVAGLPCVAASLATAPPTLGRAAIEAAMEAFAAVLLEWRQTHYRIAMRMLGERRGTGYTAGVPYLERGRRIPVFT